jgi:hypothetical protein
MSWKKDQVKTSTRLRLEYFSASQIVTCYDRRVVLVFSVNQNNLRSDPRVRPDTDCDCACE